MTRPLIILAIIIIIGAVCMYRITGLPQVAPCPGKTGDIITLFTCGAWPELKETGL